MLKIFLYLEIVSKKGEMLEPVNFKIDYLCFCNVWMDGRRKGNSIHICRSEIRKPAASIPGKVIITYIRQLTDLGGFHKRELGKGLEPPLRITKIQAPFHV